MRFIIGVLLCSLLVAADQFTKQLAVQHLMPVGQMDLIPGFIELRYHINQGAAFGILQGGRWVFLGITAVVLAALIYFFIRLPQKAKAAGITRFAIAVTMAGAIGNAVDRFMNGYVVDFLNFTFINFPIFNVADVCIVCGTILFAVLILFFYKEPSKIPLEKIEPVSTGLNNTDQNNPETVITPDAPTDNSNN